VVFNSLCIDAAVEQVAADGFPVTDDLLARLSPLQYDHINVFGRYAFTAPPAPGQRPLQQQADPRWPSRTLPGSPRSSTAT